MHCKFSLLVIFVFQFHYSLNEGDIYYKHENITIIDEFDNPVALIYGKSRIQIVCNWEFNIGNTEKIELVMDRKTIQSFIPDHNVSEHRFYLNVEDHPDFGEYKCSRGVKLSNESFLFSYSLCDDMSSACQESASCTTEVSYCARTKEYPDGKNCYDWKSLTQICQESHSLDQLYIVGCKQQTVTSLCQKNVLHLAQNSQKDGLNTCSFDFYHMVRVKDEWDYYGRAVKMEKTINLQFYCPGGISGKFITHCKMYDEPLHRLIWQYSHRSCVKSENYFYDTSVSVDENKIFGNNSYNVGRLKCTTVLSASNVSKSERKSSYDLVNIASSVQLAIESNSCYKQGVNLTCKFKPSPPSNSFFRVTEIDWYRKGTASPLKISKMVPNQSSASFIAYFYGIYICRAKIRYRTCSPFNELYFEFVSVDQPIRETNPCLSLLSDNQLPDYLDTGEKVNTSLPPLIQQEQGMETWVIAIIAGSAFIGLLAVIFAIIFMLLILQNPAKLQTQTRTGRNRKRHKRPYSAGKSQVRSTRVVTSRRTSHSSSSDRSNNQSLGRTTRRTPSYKIKRGRIRR